MAMDKETERLLTNALGGPFTQAPEKTTTEVVLSELAPYARSTQLNESSRADIETPLTLLTRQLAELTFVSRAQAESLETNTRAVIENSLAKSSGEKASTAGSIGRSILSFLGRGSVIGQVLGRLLGGDDNDEVVPTLPTYTAPPSVQVSAGVTAAGIQPLRYGSDGLPRGVESRPVPPSVPITIQVQAIDSRSFKDHSSEIAAAVREALLNSHSLNDVVLEL
jgi:hypothetical protein